MAKVFIYDVTQAQIVREIVPVPKAATTGLVGDVAPDRLLGLTLDPERPKAAILYGVDITTGDVLFRKSLPWPVSENRWNVATDVRRWTGSGRKNVRLIRKEVDGQPSEKRPPHHFGGYNRRWDEDPDFARGPDGFVWTFLKDALVRINLKDARVHVVGRIDVPGRPTFVGNDVYFTGTQHLRRIRNIVPSP